MDRNANPGRQASELTNHKIVLCASTLAEGQERSNSVLALRELLALTGRQVFAKHHKNKTECKTVTEDPNIIIRKQRKGCFKKIFV